MNVRATRFPLFDSLRAIAALSVLGTHVAVVSGVAASESVLRPYTARLDVGVSIFFVISGFLLYRPFVRARLNDEPSPRTGAYAWRRFLRIVPAYWVALTAVALVLGLHYVFTVAGALRYYGFAQIYDGDTAFLGITQAWSLCIEVTFYAFLPLWAWGMRRLRASERRRRVRHELVGVALLALASLGYKAAVLSFVDPATLSEPQPPWLMPLPSFLDQFALGMALAVLSVWYEDRERPPRPLRALDRWPALGWLAAGLAFWAVSTQIGLSGVFGERLSDAQWNERHLLFAVVAVGLVAPAVFGDQARGAVRRLLANRALLYLGLVSYAIYLYHLALLTQLSRWDAAELLGAGTPLAYAAWAVAGLAGSVLLATLSYYAVERPALSLKRLAGPLETPAPEEAIAEPAPIVPPAAARSGS